VNEAHHAESGEAARVGESGARSKSVLIWRGKASAFVPRSLIPPSEEANNLGPCSETARRVPVKAFDAGSGVT